MPRRLWAVAVLLLAVDLHAQQSPPQPLFKLEEVMIPVRDGVRLQTVILTPVDRTAPLPILFRRTPYGVPDEPPRQMPASIKELAQDGYIFVIQNLRGRFKSEGVFKLTSQVDLKDSTSTNETTDAYDSIDWLVKHVPNNGNVGMSGVSYDGLTTALALLHPHPALKAMSEQARPVEQRMNNDDHRYGALRESYAFEYAVLEQADKFKNTHFAFETYDTYSWYLELGPLSNINAKYLHGSIPYWNDVVAHPDYDEFWKQEAWVRQLHASTVPNLNVAGFWDQEDPWGPWQIFRHAAAHDPDHTNFMVAGPWYHGQWRAPKADSIGLVALGGSRNGARVPRDHRGALLPLLPARAGGETRLAGDHVPVGREPLADLRRVAAPGGPPDEPVPARRRHAVVRAPACRRERVPRVCLRSGQPGAAPAAAHLAHLPGWRLAHVGGPGPAVRRGATGRAHLRRHAARPRSHDHRRSVGRPVRVDVGRGRRLRGQADRRVSGGCPAERVGRRGGPAARRVRAIDQRVRAADRDGGAPGSLPGEL